MGSAQRSGRPVVASLALHAGLAAVLFLAPIVEPRRAPRPALALEIDVSPAPARTARADPPVVAPPETTTPEAPATVHRDRPPRRDRRAPPSARTEARAAVPSVRPEPPALTPEIGEPRQTPARPFSAFDSAALAAAIEVPAPRAPGGTTIRGDGAGGAEADEGAVDGVRAVTEELRERAQSGRPEAAGVVTYFSDTRRRLAANWAPRTVHLPSRTKAMVQSMQAVNRAAIDMMEGRSERAVAAREDGRVTPDEWRSAMREAAMRARAVASVIVAIVHDAQGRVVEVRITRSSGYDDLDRAVLAAAREALDHEPAPPMPEDAVATRPAGRVARYRFDVMMTAIPPVPPVAGVTFDESTGMFRVFYPGQINWRLKVTFLGARHGTDIRPASAESD